MKVHGIHITSIVIVDDHEALMNVLDKLMLFSTLAFASQSLDHLELVKLACRWNQSRIEPMLWSVFADMQLYFLAFLID